MHATLFGLLFDRQKFKTRHRKAAWSHCRARIRSYAAAPYVAPCGCLSAVDLDSWDLSAQAAEPDIQPASTLDGPAPMDVDGPLVPDRQRRKRRAIQAKRASEMSDLAASYARYSGHLQHEESNSDQQRECRKLATANGHNIMPEHEYADSAISGTKAHRDGLDAMLRAAAAGEFKVLYFFSLSRLARESVITMPLLKRLVHTYGVRIISITEGIDSHKDGWEVIATIMSLMAERFIKELSANTLRGLVGALDAGFSLGDHRFGYRSEPIPGSEQTRRGKNPRPRKYYVIDAVESAWVVRIFHWFVRERRSLSWIVRELNRRGAPKDHRSSTPDWYSGSVVDLLSSEKYIGIWPWGLRKNVRDPFTGTVHQEFRPEEECEAWIRQLPDLRIIDDQIFQEAQQRLQANYEKYAGIRTEKGHLNWKGRGSKDCPPMRLLSKLMICEGCEEAMYIGSKYLYCDQYQRGVCSCQTRLPIARATRMLLAEIGKRIAASGPWFNAVFAQLLSSWREREAHLPGELAAAKQTLADLDDKISRLVSSIEDGTSDPGVLTRLEDRRHERRDLAKKVEALQRVADARTPQPTEEWLRAKLSELEEVLKDETPAAIQALQDLLGNKVILREIRDEGRQRFRLQGRFKMRTMAILGAVTGQPAYTPGTGPTSANAEVGPTGGLEEEVIIDFVEPDPLLEGAMAARKLYDQRVLNVEIGRQLGCSKSMVTKLLRHSFALEGKEMPDGRERRSTLETKHTVPPLYLQISEQVFELCEEGKLRLGDIADQLGVDRNTVTQAMKFAYESRGLRVPDGRSRRKKLPRKPGRPGHNQDPGQQPDAA